MVVEKFASSPMAAASSFNVLRTAGAPLVSAVIAAVLSATAPFSSAEISFDRAVFRLLT